LRDQKVRPLGVEGLDAQRWVLVDFGDVIVHVFDPDMRGFYDLEGIWSDAPRIPIPADVPAVPASQPSA
jgi:ribosome-associated protein